MLFLGKESSIKLSEISNNVFTRILKTFAGNVGKIEYRDLFENFVEGEFNAKGYNSDEVEKIKSDIRITGFSSVAELVDFRPTILDPTVETYNDTEELTVAIGRYLDDQKNSKIATILNGLAMDVRANGLTSDLYETLSPYVRSNTDLVIKPVDVMGMLFDTLQKKDGYKFYLKEFDNSVPGIEEASVVALFGYAGHGKTTLALNILLKNIINLKKNSIYFSLEVPREQIIFKLMAMYAQVEGQKIKVDKSDFMDKNKLVRWLRHDSKTEFRPDMIDFVNKFQEHILGHLYIVDQSSMDDMSEGDFRKMIEKIDKEYFNENLNGIFWDQASLFKYFSSSKRHESYSGEIINRYVSFIRKMGLSFRRGKDGSMRKLTNFILAQAKRQAFESADKNKDHPGLYQSSAIGEANEIERSAYYIVSCFLNDEMKRNNEARVQLLKSREGLTFVEPVTIYFNGAVGIMGDGFDLSLQDIEDMYQKDQQEKKESKIIDNMIELVAEVDKKLSQELKKDGLVNFDNWTASQKDLVHSCLDESESDFMSDLEEMNKKKKVQNSSQNQNNRSGYGYSTPSTPVPSQSKQQSNYNSSSPSNYNPSSSSQANYNSSSPSQANYNSSQTHPAQATASGTKDYC